MNVARTVEMASVVDPNTSPSSRVQRLSRISPDEPERKKQASRTARIGGRTLYRDAADYSAAVFWAPCQTATIQTVDFSTRQKNRYGGTITSRCSSFGNSG